VDNAGHSWIFSQSYQQMQQLILIPASSANDMGMIDIDGLLAANDGVLFARDHRRLKSSLSRWVKKGLLVRILRGAYAHPHHGARATVLAVTGMISSGVIAGHSALALQLSDWPQPSVVEVCAPGKHLPQKGFHFLQRSIPQQYVSHHVMSPVLAAVDIADETSDALDLLMRQHRIEPTRYQAVLKAFPHRRGNRRRQKVVDRSMSRPWSKAEREYHDLFDRYHLKGWTANQKVFIAGRWVIPDAAFHKEQLAIEIDSFEHPTRRETFENDRLRHNALTQAGWTVLHFTWDMLNEPDMVIHTIKATLARLRRRQKITAQ